MGMEPTFNPAGLFGFRDWKSGDENVDRGRTDRLLNFLREAYPRWTAAQMKQFLADAVNAIDNVSRI